MSGDSSHGMGAERGVRGRISLDPFLSCRAVSQTSASRYTPVGVDGLEVREWTLASPAAASSSASGAAAAFQGAKGSVAAVPSPWPRPSSPPTWCCCCFSAPSQGKDGLLALTILAGAAKISDLVQEEPVPPSHGAHLGPSSGLERAGMGWPCAWLLLFSILWCWISKVWKTAGCGGQAEPPTSTCPGITGSDSPGVGA